MNAVTLLSAFPASVQPGIPKLGEQPRGWTRAPLSRFLQEVKRPLKMDDNEVYQLVTVKRSRGGVVERSRLKGKDISVKSQFLIEPGDFLISKRQIVHGACGLVPEELGGSIVSNEYSILNGNGEIDLDYLNYLAHSTFFQQTCFHSSIGVHVEKMIFKLDRWLDWDFDLPPLPEQRKIAEILSTWDRAIEVSEALLATARTQKRALMQSLLTGKRRFPEFAGQEWKKVRLADVTAGKKKKGRIVSTNSDAIGIPYIGAASFEGDFAIYTDAPEALICEPNDLLVLWDGENAGAATVGLKGAVSSTVVRFRFDPTQASSSFVFSLIELRNAEIRAIREGSGIPHMPKDFEDWFIFTLPSIEEQKKIMYAVNAARDEERALRTAIDHLRTEKKALMQQLLTGKRRVTINA